MEMTPGKIIAPVTSDQPYSSAQLLTGRILRRFRELKGVSQGHLALVAAAHLSYISSLECGKCNISIKKAEMICNALDSSFVSLISIQYRLALSLVLSSAKVAAQAQTAPGGYPLGSSTIFPSSSSTRIMPRP
jgi:transcriptional regulator with XRE-family HTH domain